MKVVGTEIVLEPRDFERFFRLLEDDFLECQIQIYKKNLHPTAIRVPVQGFTFYGVPAVLDKDVYYDHSLHSFVNPDGSPAAPVHHPYYRTLDDAGRAIVRRAV